jgi:hypothetical protein
MRWHLFTKTLLALLLVISLHELASEHYVRRDFSRSHRFSLSEQGSVLFSKIQRPAHMTIYYSPNSSTEGSELFDDLEALMQEYQIKGRENLMIEYLDPIRDLERARELQRRYRFNPNENAVIIDYMDHTKIIPFKELGDYDSSSSEESPRLIAFRGEQVINAALIELSEIPLKKIYFLQGHGEKIPGVAPLEVVGRYLEHQYVTLQPLLLATTYQQVPEDAALVMVLGALYDISEEEAEILKNYWRHSGRLLILLDPTAITPHLFQVTQEAGILPREDRLLRSYPSGNATISCDVIGSFSSGCELTKQFLGLNILFTVPTESLEITSRRSKSLVEEEATPASSAASTSTRCQQRPLVEAVPGFWSSKEREQEAAKELSFIEGKEELPTPLIIAAVADLGALHDDRVAVNAGRMIVVGNSDFIQDKNISEIGLDFFSSSLNGLIDRVQLTGNTAKMKAYLTLNLHDEQMQQIILWSILIIPLSGAVAALTIFWRRHS